MEHAITAILFVLVWACLAYASRPADYRCELGLDHAFERSGCKGRRERACRDIPWET